MATPRDIQTFIEACSGSPLGGDEYVTFGSPTAELAGVTVCWMLDAEAVEAAAAAGHNCIVHHEALTFPYPGLSSGGEPTWLAWPTNARRLGALSAAGMTAVRIHASADRICIFDDFAAALGLTDVLAGADDPHGAAYARKVFASPVDTFGELIAHVKACLSMDAVRATPDPPGRPVRRIGLPWGGLGLFVNVGFMQSLIELGVDTLICGETDNYGIRFAAEVGIAVIETSHEVSESPGLRRLAEMLGEHLGVPTAFHEQRCAWEMR